MTEEQIAYCKQWVDLETRGEAIFRTQARRAPDADQRAKWTLLADIESAMKAALLHHLRTNGIAVEESPEKRREGEIFAEQSAVSWPERMAQMRPRVLYYVEELRALAAAAPAAQRTLATRLLEHEEALLAFVDRELAGDARTSLEPVRAHLEKWCDRTAE